MIRVAIADDQQLCAPGSPPWSTPNPTSKWSARPPPAPKRSRSSTAHEARRRADGHPDARRRRPVGDRSRSCRDPELAGTHIVIVTTFELDEYVAQAIRAGASGFLVKDTEPVELIRAVRVVAGGRRAAVARASPGDCSSGSPARSARRPDASALDVLTEREREVLGLVGRGLTNEEIGRTLFLSPLTAKTHVSRIMSKLAARDRVHLVVVAYETGLVRAGYRE